MKLTEEMKNNGKMKEISMLSMQRQMPRVYFVYGRPKIFFISKLEIFY